MSDERLPVCVVIPAYRRPLLLRRAVRSVLAQRPRPERILVVDDASGDDTGAVAEAMGVQVVAHAENQGEGAARNTGIAHATETWIALLDSDDEWLPGHLATLWAARDRHVLLGSLGVGTGEGAGAGRIYGHPSALPYVLTHPAEVLVPQNKFCASATMFRRDVALAAGGFPVGMPRAADLDMWVRMLELGTALTIPQVTVLYHVHADQITGDAPPMWAAHRDVLDGYAGKPWLTRKTVMRHEGVVAWDRARAEMVDGASRARSMARLAARIVHPTRAQGVIELLLERRRGRGIVDRLKREGRFPSTGT